MGKKSNCNILASREKKRSMEGAAEDKQVETLS